MSTELRSLAAAMVAHQFAGARPLDAADSYQRARFMVAGVVFGVYYRGSSYVFSWFAKKGTSALTSEPTTALVTEGPYAVSRNPALLLVWVFHVACAVAFNSWWPLLVALPLTYAYLTLITVPNEEEELEKLFGRQYRDYKQQTPRFLIPHSWRLARLCRRVCGDDACGNGDSKSATVDEDVDMGSDYSQAQDTTENMADAAEQQSVRRRQSKETDRLRQMFAQRGVDLDDDGEDEQMLRALLSKFEGHPHKLEQAVSNVAKMASELAPAAVEAAAGQLYTETEAKHKPYVKTSEQTSKGAARRRSRTAQKSAKD